MLAQTPDDTDFFMKLIENHILTGFGPLATAYSTTIAKSGDNYEAGLLAFWEAGKKMTTRLPEDAKAWVFNFCRPLPDRDADPNQCGPELGAIPDPVQWKKWLASWLQPSCKEAG